MWSSSLAYLSVLAIPLVHGLVTPVKRADVCNKHAELCGRSYGNWNIERKGNDSRGLTDSSRKCYISCGARFVCD
ncbi:hypothetical protein DL96DRAFT_1601720 [Flagelloscypha sp. PMI_526]|nr:hypothetical protein DL96DRAFT_1601720 [Flagelloscypha sp. PMI_526]